MVYVLLASGCSNSIDSGQKNIDQRVPVNFIMPNSERTPFLFSNLNEVLMSVDHGVGGKTVIIKSGSGYSEVLFDKKGVLTELFNPLTGHRLISRVLYNHLYLVMYNQQKKFMYGITVFEKNNSIWIADVAVLPAFSGQIVGSPSGEVSTNLLARAHLDSGLNNIRKADAKTLRFVELLTKSAQGDRINEEDRSAEASLAIQYAAIGAIDVGFNTVVVKNNASEIRRDFAGAVLAIIGQMLISNDANSENLLKCLDNVEACKKGSDDLVVNSSMEMFGGLWSKDDNHDILKSIMSGSKLRWDILAGSTYRFFDPKTDSKPPSFKPLGK